MGAPGPPKLWCIVGLLGDDTVDTMECGRARGVKSGSDVCGPTCPSGSLMGSGNNEVSFFFRRGRRKNIVVVVVWVVVVVEYAI